MNKNITENLTNNKNNSKKFMNDIINTASETINVEKIANKINNKIIEEKIKNFGIKDQEYSSQCWVYSLSEIIYMANARKYGRKLEDFHQIYNTIVNIFGKGGKTNEQMEIIMSKILPLYNLKYEKIENEEKLKNFLKKGIKCIATFKLNEKEWNNFSEYFNDYKIKDEEKLLTKEILERQNDKVEDSGKTTGHSVILTDIDNDDNYLLINSWGKNWGNKGIFKSKKECLKSSAFYAIYFTSSELSKDEVEEWDNLIKDINKYLKNLKNIRCPICKRSAPIQKYEIEIEDENKKKLVCPFESKCIFEINDNLDFLVEQLLCNDLNKNMSDKNKFKYGFG